MFFNKNYLCLSLTIFLFLISSLSSESFAEIPAPNSRLTKAGYLTITKQKIPHTIVLSGQSIAEKDATIRPLVDGVITDILYKAGREVKKGTPLFQIEQESYLADLEVAKAALESAKAAVVSGEENYARYKKLAGTGISKSEVDVARTDLRQAQAAVRSAQADVTAAQINLDRTTIKSPIDGIVATASVSIGDLVTAGQSDALTSVTALDPISVDLSDTSSRLLETRRKIDSGEIKRGSEIEAVLILENGEQYKERGVVETLSSSVSTSTGTITVRVKFDNPEYLVLPGVFLRAKLTLGTIDGYLVPQLAAEPQADGTITVWVIDADNTAHEMHLLPQGNTEKEWIVTSGFERDVKIIVDNIDSLKEGETVDPVAVEINDQGVVQDI